MKYTIRRVQTMIVLIFFCLDHVTGANLSSLIEDYSNKYVTVVESRGCDTCILKDNAEAFVSSGKFVTDIKHVASSLTDSNAFQELPLSADENILDRNLLTSSHNRSAMFPTQSLVKNPADAIVNAVSRLDSIRKLFEVSNFKGIGLSMSKSTFRWNAFAVGIKVPITQLFPDYDRILYLPRVGASLACCYPFSFKWKLSATIPTRMTVHLLAILAKNLQKISNDGITRLICQPEATDSIRRFGFSVTARYNDAGVKYSVGLIVQHTSSKHFTESLLPNIVTIPAVIMTILSPVNLDTITSSACRGDSSDLAVMVDETSATISNRLPTTISKPEETISSTQARMKRYSYWSDFILAWIRKKSVGLHWGFGCYKSNYDSSAGSSVSIAVQPFVIPFSAAIKAFHRFFESSSNQMQRFFILLIRLAAFNTRSTAQSLKYSFDTSSQRRKAVPVMS